MLPMWKCCQFPMEKTQIIQYPASSRIDNARGFMYNALDFKTKKRKNMTTSLTIRMDETLKAEAEEFFDDIGLNMTTAITCFFKKCLAAGEIPFKLSRQSKHERLLAAMKEADEVANDPNAPTCTDPDKLEEFMLS